MSWLIIFCYIFFSYGISVLFTHTMGPFDVFYRLRKFTNDFSPSLGMLFKCMVCFPTNVGIWFSLFNWFFLPIAISPFNMILKGTDLWWLAAIMDGCLTGGICRIIWNLDDLMDKITPIYEDEL